MIFELSVMIARHYTSQPKVKEIVRTALAMVNMDAVRSANPHLSDRLITPRPSSGGAASGPLSAMDESHKLKDFMRGLVSLFLRANSREDIGGLLDEG